MISRHFFQHRLAERKGEQGMNPVITVIERQRPAVRIIGKGVGPTADSVVYRQIKSVFPILCCSLRGNNLVIDSIPVQSGPPRV